MVTSSSLRPSFRLALAALLGLALAACDAVTSLSGPTHHYVIEAVEDARGDQPGDLDAAVRDSVGIVEQRLDAVGITVHEITPLGDGRLALKTSGESSSEVIGGTLGSRGELAMRMVDDSVPYENLEMGIAPPGSEVLEMRDGFERLAVKRIGGIRGDRIARADAGHDPYMNEPMVSIAFDEEGGRQFARLSSENVGRRFAIILDDEVISAPVFNEPILGGQAQISGGFSVAEARQLAAMLQSGALPVGFAVIEERVIE